jgi:hypothetical protein
LESECRIKKTTLLLPGLSLAQLNELKDKIEGFHSREDKKLHADTAHSDDAEESSKGTSDDSSQECNLAAMATDDFYWSDDSSSDESDLEMSDDSIAKCYSAVVVTDSNSRSDDHSKDHCSLVATVTHEHDWVINSGASSHYSNNLGDLSNFSTISKASNVVTATGSKLQLLARAVSDFGQIKFQKFYMFP